MKSGTPGLHYGYVALAVASLVLLTTLGFGRFAYSLILPGMKEGLSLNYTQAGLLGTSNMIGYLVAVPVAGVFASRYGSRLVMAASMGVTGLLLLATGASPGFEWALSFQVLAGIASAGAVVPAMAMGGIWAASHKRGIASGCVSAGMGLFFFTSGPTIPAIVASSADMGWRLAWYLTGAVILVSGIIAAVLVRDSPQRLGLEVLGFRPDATPRERPGDPLSWGVVYRSRAVWHLAALYSIFGFAYISYLTFFAAFLSQQGGLNEGVIGNMWAISGAGMIAGALGWGLLSDRLGRKISLAIVFLALGGSILLFTASHSVVIYTLSTVLFWAAEPGVPVIVAATCGDCVGARLAPAAMGFTTLFMGIGQAIGPVVTGSMADLTASFYMSFYIAALVAALGVISSLLLRTPKARL